MYRKSRKLSIKSSECVFSVFPQSASVINSMGNITAGSQSNLFNDMLIISLLKYVHSRLKFNVVYVFFMLQKLQGNISKLFSQESMKTK